MTNKDIFAGIENTARVAQILSQLLLVKRAQDTGVQVIVEGPW